MRETIEKITCDCCCKEMQRGFGFFKLNFPVRDYLGNQCAMQDIEYKDLCEDCCKKLETVIRGVETK